MASGIYTCFKEDLMLGDVDLGNGANTINVALYDDSHAFTATDTVYTTDNELATANGYTQGGETLANQAVTAAATTKFDADDVAWTTSSFTAYHAVLYNSTNSDSLIASIDFGGAKTVASGTFTIQWHTDGIITLATAA
jgi:hypothetical protein